MELPKYYLVCDECGESNTKKANGDRGKMYAEAVKDGWKRWGNNTHHCPKCSEKQRFEINQSSEPDFTPNTPDTKPDSPEDDEDY